MKRRTINVLSLILIVSLSGCGTQQTNQRGFFTSGDREADQRADQRMATVQQARGGNEKTNEKNSATTQKSLYDQLGGEQTVKMIVDDCVSRALADPRVNWDRTGVKQGGFKLSRGKSVEWKASPENVE